MKPKLWQGPTAIGQAHSRALNNLPSRVGTSYGFETLDNGQLGTTMSKKCGDYNEVYRYGGQEDPKYFLCTWQHTVVTMLSRTTQRKEVLFTDPQNQPFGGQTSTGGVSESLVGNCEYVGDGFVAGFVDKRPDGAASIVLMRVPTPGKVLSAEDYKKRFPEHAAAGINTGYSVEIELPADTIFFNFTVIPLGWKDEKARYVFAVTDLTVSEWLQGNAALSLFIVSTATLGATRIQQPHWPPPHSDGYLRVATDLACTARGTMEVVIYGDGPMSVYRSTDFGESWSSSFLDDGWEYSGAANEYIFSPHLTGGVIVGAGDTTFIAVQTLVGGRYLWDIRTAVVMFKRTGGGDYTLIPWPGDEFLNEPPQTDIRDVSSTRARKQVLHPTLHHYVGAAPTSWASTGDGCAAFFFFDSAVTAGNNEEITVIATVDGGETWNTRVIENSINMSQMCVLAGDAREPSAFLFAAIDPETSQTQLYRMTADLIEVKRYGPPYPDPWRRGLINFKDYVHPGFPGVYDGPDTQPRKPA